MEYHVTLHQQPVDLGRLDDRLRQEDPGAAADQSGDVLRVSCYLRGDELLGLLREQGLILAENDVELQPSICCGGCSG